MGRAGRADSTASCWRPSCAAPSGASQEGKAFESLDNLALVLGLTEGKVGAIHNETCLYKKIDSTDRINGI